MKGTSYRIKRRITRLRAITAHVSPYPGGLAPETRKFVEVINEEAERHKLRVKFTALANRIEVSGAIESAAASNTLLGWFVRRAIRTATCTVRKPFSAVAIRNGARNCEGVQTKDGMREKAEHGKAIREREETRRIAEAGDAFIGPSALVPGSWPKAWIGGVYMPILRPDKPRDGNQ